MPETIFVVGVEGSGKLGVSADQLAHILLASELIVGSERQLSLVQDQTSLPLPASISWEGGIDTILAKLSECNQAAMVLASGDPGYFGVVRLLRAKLPTLKLDIYPVPSSVSLAFARLGMNWEDSLVISAHGRKNSDVLMELIQACGRESKTSKLAVFCSPEYPPQYIAQVLLDLNASFDKFVVAIDIGGPSEAFHEQSLDSLSNQEFSHHALLLAFNETESSNPNVSNRASTPDSERFLHRDGMISKTGVRELAFAKLDPYLIGGNKCFWDLGAGSGSVGISAAERHPNLQVLLVDHDPISVRLASINSSHLSNITIVHARAQDVLGQLRPPDAVFIGGGGIGLLRGVLEHLQPHTFVLCTHASINRATDAGDLLGNLMQVILPLGKRLRDGTWRLDGENPVFMSWGLSR